MNEYENFMQGMRGKVHALLNNLGSDPTYRRRGQLEERQCKKIETVYLSLLRLEKYMEQAVKR